MLCIKNSTDAKFAGFFSLSFRENALWLSLRFLRGVLKKTAIKYPQAPQKNDNCSDNGDYCFFEERSGGVAAIEQPR
jgi:hypothetical protein